MLYDGMLILPGSEKDTVDKVGMIRLGNISVPNIFHEMSVDAQYNHGLKFFIE